MWFSDRYRRHLCDMHIDDWDERFFSEYVPENYVQALKTAHFAAYVFRELGFAVEPAPEELPEPQKEDPCCD